MLFILSSSWTNYSLVTKNFYHSNTLQLSVPQEIDEYDLVDPVDILTPLEKSGFWEGVVGDFDLLLKLIIIYIY